MYQLYYSPGACSMAIHVVLNEVNQPVDLKPINLQEKRPEELLKLNPRGQVPVLVEDGKPMREGGAMMVYLCDKHKSALMPQSGWERAQALQWLMWGNSSLHPAYSRTFWIMRNVKDEAMKTQLLETSVVQINAMWAEVDQHLGNWTFLAGKECTAADILMTVIANWGQWLPPGSIKLGDNVKRVLRAVIARPAYQKALAAEKVDYKAAA